MKVLIQKRRNGFKKVALGIFFLAIALVFLSDYLKIPAYFSAYVFQQGAYYFNGGEYNLEKAEKFYKIGRVLEPKNHLADYQLARIHFVQNELELSEMEIGEAIAKNPENKRSFYVKGLIDGYAKNYAEAQEDFQKFVEWSPEEWAGYNDLAWVYFEDGKFQEAAKAAEDGLLVAPDNPWLLNGAGVSYQAMGDFQKAEEYLGEVKKISANMSVEDWGRAYPGNSPENYPWDLARFRSDVGINLVLAVSRSDQKGNFHSACAASTVGQCGSDRCNQVGCVECDSDADRAAGNCCDSYSNVCTANWQCDSSCKCTGVDKCGDSVIIPCSLSGRNLGESFCGANDREVFCRVGIGGTGSLVISARRCTQDCVYPCNGNLLVNSQACSGDSTTSTGAAWHYPLNGICSTKECEFVCRSGYIWNGLACVLINSSTCGNGIPETGEQCDTGASRGACPATCSLACTNNVCGGGAVCGNGTREGSEECDDGNTNNGDGCDSNCKNESGGGSCGDGNVDSGEECDDNNTSDGDGCDSSCKIEGTDDPWREVNP